MNYTEFKDHLITFLWKDGDQQLINSLDNLIAMADAELRTTLRVSDRETSTIITTSDLQTLLPPDYHSMRGVAAADPTLNLKEFTYMSPAALTAQYSISNTNFWRPHYSLQDKFLILLGPTTGDPENEIELLINYKQGVPDFKLADTSWVADEFLNVYTYGVLKHSGMFLREDERLPNWVMLAEDGVSKAVEDSEHNRQIGVYASKQLPRTAGIIRRR